VTHRERVTPSDGITDATATADPSSPGIFLTRVWLVSASFEDATWERILDTAKVDFDPGESMDVDPTADIWLSDESAALVRLTIRAAPVKQPTFSVVVSYAALYTVSGTPVVPLEDFAWGNGLANLVPFVRAKIAALTGESGFPAFYLQPINLSELRTAPSEALTHAPEALAAEGATGKGEARLTD
jgi:preprotein translocase subunit SecB